MPGKARPKNRPPWCCAEIVYFWKQPRFSRSFTHNECVYRFFYCWHLYQRHLTILPAKRTQTFWLTAKIYQQQFLLAGRACLSGGSCQGGRGAGGREATHRWGSHISWGRWISIDIDKYDSPFPPKNLMFLPLLGDHLKMTSCSLHEPNSRALAQVSNQITRCSFALVPLNQANCSSALAVRTREPSLLKPSPKFLSPPMFTYSGYRNKVETGNLGEASKDSAWCV